MSRYGPYAVIMAAWFAFGVSLKFAVHAINQVRYEGLSIAVRMPGLVTPPWLLAAGFIILCLILDATGLDQKIFSKSGGGMDSY